MIADSSKLLHSLGSGQTPKPRSTLNVVPGKPKRSTFFASQIKIVEPDGRKEHKGTLSVSDSEEEEKEMPIKPADGQETPFSIQELEKRFPGIMGAHAHFKERNIDSKGLFSNF